MAETPQHRDASRWLWVMLCLAAVLRCGVMVWHSEQLTIDRDAYLGIAENLVHGNGFCTPGTTSPTAFRPPLYPLILAACFVFLPTTWAVAVINLLAGLATIWCVDHIGGALRLGPWRHVATLLVAVDPLLLNATPQPMTEVVFTALTTAWLCAVIGQQPSDRPPRRAFLIGCLFGLAALCRPTIWPLAGLLALAWVGQRLMPSPTPGFAPPPRGRGGNLPSSLHWVATLAGVLLIVGPWVMRNQLVFGRAILTTTHGGYTLLLGNNPVYFQEVVAQPWGTTWSGESLARWQHDMENRIRDDIGPQTNEIQRDAWMSSAAKQYIRAEPQQFLQAAIHRVRSLWAVSPQGEGKLLPGTVRLAVAGFFVAVYLLAAVGLWQILRRGEWPIWLPALLLIVTIQGVHLAYWTDARMRTPLVPVLALLAARALTRGKSVGD